MTFTNGNKNLDLSGNAILNKFPTVVSFLEVTWGEPEFYDYINKLTIADRNIREGFPPEVFVEILNLRNLHDQLFPSLHPKINVWDNRI